MQTYKDLVTLAHICAKNARSAATTELSRELWKMANEYRARALARYNDKAIDIGQMPERLKD